MISSRAVLSDLLSDLFDAVCKNIRAGEDHIDFFGEVFFNNVVHIFHVRPLLSETEFTRMMPNKCEQTLEPDNGD
jgi:hypothetical protein